MQFTTIFTTALVLLSATLTAAHPKVYLTTFERKVVENEVTKRSNEIMHERDLQERDTIQRDLLQREVERLNDNIIRRETRIHPRSFRYNRDL